MGPSPIHVNIYILIYFLISIYIYICIHIYTLMYICACTFVHMGQAGESVGSAV